MTLPRVVLTSQPTTEGLVSSPREQLSNQIAHISHLQRKTTQVWYIIVLCRGPDVKTYDMTRVYKWKPMGIYIKRLAYKLSPEHSLQSIYTHVVL